jgi:hypothetical protein
MLHGRKLTGLSLTGLSLTGLSLTGRLTGVRTMTDIAGSRRSVAE